MRRPSSQVAMLPPLQLLWQTWLRPCRFPSTGINRRRSKMQSQRRLPQAARR